MDHLEVSEKPMDWIKTETNDNEARISMLPPNNTELYQARTSVDNQGSTNPGQAETSSSSSEEKSAEEVQAQSQAAARGISSVDQAETSPSHVSNPVLTENPVSKDHLNSLLVEAKDFYKSRPPFVSSTSKLHQAGDKRTVLLALPDGHHPASNARRIEMVYYSWDHDSVYATMDLNGSTEIVQVRAGGSRRGSVETGRGGAQVRLWLGAEQGFSTRPVGYPEPSSSALPAVKRTAASAHSQVLSNEPSPKRILRASKPIRVSDNRILFNWTGEPDDTHERSLRPRAPRKATSIGATTESDLSSSSDSDDDGDGDDDTALVLRQEMPDSGGLKGLINKSSALPTPSASMPRTLRSYDDDAADQTDANDADSFEPVMNKEEIDALLLQLRSQGKTFGSIRDHIDGKTGKNTTVGCWWSRYRRIERAQAENRAGKAARSRPAKINHGRPFKPLSGHLESLEDNTEESVSKSTSVNRDLHRSPDLGVASTKKPKSAAHRSIKESDQAIESTPGQQDPRDRSHKRLSLRLVNSTHDSTSPSYLETPKETSQRPSRANTADQHHNKPTPPTAALHAALDMSGEGLLLTPQKLNHTTLRILHSGSYTPLKLRSCNTMGALFNTVRDLCSLKLAQERVEALKMTFTWMPEGDSSRTMLLKEQYEDSFEFFLETVGEAPCWQNETGKCNVDIEMV